MIVTHDRAEIEAKAQIAKGLGAETRICGYWVWARFAGKPSGEILIAIKAAGFRWMTHKREWAFKGALSTSRQSMDWGYIIGKYGEEIVQ